MKHFFFRKSFINPRLKHFYLLLLFFILIFNWLIYFEISQVYATADESIKSTFPELIKIQEGDVILRNGKGLLSSIFRSSSLKDPYYTHAGVIHEMNKSWFVYHYIDEDLKSGLHIEPLSNFVDKQFCSSLALLRYPLKPIEKIRFDSLLIISNKQAIPFDNEFSLTSDSAYYCTEWIAKLLERSTLDKDYIPVTSVGQYSYIAPDNLYLNEHCKLIYKYEYQ